jgi:hypothetical protein
MPNVAFIAPNPIKHAPNLEQFPGIEQVILDHLTETFAGIRQITAEKKLGEMVPYLARRKLIAESMLRSHALRNAPDEFHVRMAPLDRRLYQEKSLLANAVAHYDLLSGLYSAIAA